MCKYAWVIDNITNFVRLLTIQTTNCQGMTSVIPTIWDVLVQKEHNTLSVKWNCLKT